MREVARESNSIVLGLTIKPPLVRKSRDDYISRATRNKPRKLAGTLGLRWNNRQGELAVETKLIKCHEDVVGLRSITVNLAHGARSGSKKNSGGNSRGSAAFSRR